MTYDYSILPPRNVHLLRGMLPFIERQALRIKATATHAMRGSTRTWPLWTRTALLEIIDLASDVSRAAETAQRSIKRHQWVPMEDALARVINHGTKMIDLLSGGPGPNGE